MAELLLSKNAVVNAKNIEGKTPLRLAVAKSNADVVGLLRQQGGRE